MSPCLACDSYPIRVFEQLMSTTSTTRKSNPQNKKRQYLQSCRVEVETTGGGGGAAQMKKCEMLK